MRTHSVTIVLIALALAVTACSDSDGSIESVATESSIVVSSTLPPVTTPLPDTTTTMPVTTVTIEDTCAAATNESIAAFDGILDRIDIDPEATVKAFETSDTLTNLLGDLGGLLAVSCGPDETGEALSELLVHLASEATSHTPLAQAFLEGVMPGFCGIGIVELTIAAQAICATL